MNLKTVEALIEESGMSNVKIASEIKMQRSVMTHLRKGRIHKQDNQVEVGLERVFKVSRGSLRSSVSIPKALSAYGNSTTRNLKLLSIAEAFGFTTKKMDAKDWAFIGDLADGIMDRRDEFIKGRSWDHSAVKEKVDG